MKALKLLTFILIFFSSVLRGYGQCDLGFFEELVEPEKPFNFLKRYSILIRPVADEPFSAQYSYVFTKGSTYGFILKESRHNTEKVSFTLTNNKGETLNDQLFEIDGEKNNVLVYRAPTTGIYYLNLSAQKSFYGCATLQLSFFRELDLLLTDREQTFRKEFHATRFGRHETYLKEFLVSARANSDYTYILTKDKRYGVYVEGVANDQLISLAVRNSSKENVTTEAISQGKGLLYIITPEKTEMFYFDFQNPSKRDIGFARLMELENVTQ